MAALALIPHEKAVEIAETPGFSVQKPCGRYSSIAFGTRLWNAVASHSCGDRRCTGRGRGRTCPAVVFVVFVVLAVRRTSVLDVTAGIVGITKTI